MGPRIYSQVKIVDKGLVISADMSQVKDADSFYQINILYKDNLLPALVDEPTWKKIKLLWSVVQA